MFLSDAELISLLDQEQPVITDLDLGEGDERYGEEAPVQPCSVDLAIGEVFLPGAKSGKPGSAGLPLKGEILKPGQTAVITTLERCCFPSHIAAIGFPPNSVSSQGILMTNPGHVDPGYNDTMSFTVINMSNKNYPLQRGDKIVTLLLFELPTPAKRNLAHRRGGDEPSPTEKVAKLLSVLSPDFLGISTRVREAASRQERWTRMIAIAVPILIGLIAVAATILTSAFGTKDEIHELRARIDTVSNVEKLERRVRLLERGPRADRGPLPVSAGGGGQ